MGWVVHQHVAPMVVFIVNDLEIFAVKPNVIRQFPLKSTAQVPDRFPLVRADEALEDPCPLTAVQLEGGRVLNEAFSHAWPEFRSLS